MRFNSLALAAVLLFFLMKSAMAEEAETQMDQRISAIRLISAFAN